MKSITDDLKTTIENSTINLIRCWKITLTNGDIVGFTTNNEKITYDNVEYLSVSSDNIEDIKSNIDVEEDSFKISNIISSDLISANDILSGNYSNAEIEIFLLNGLNLNQGKVSLLKGKVSDIEYKDNIFIAKVIGLKNELNKEIGDVYTPLCRASFCGEKCKLNKNNFIFNGVISSVKDNSTFSTTDSVIISKANGYFENGVIEFKSGNNIGKKMEIKQFNSGNFILSIELPYILNIGDEFNVMAGCDKIFETCCDKFNNAINFRGEPHLPGIDIILKVM